MHGTPGRATLVWTPSDSFDLTLIAPGDFYWMLPLTRKAHEGLRARLMAIRSSG